MYHAKELVEADEHCQAAAALSQFKKDHIFQSINNN
jgi:hypothetical protein